MTSEKASLTVEQVESRAGRAILVGVAFGGAARAPDSLDELDALANSAGVVVAERLICRRPRPDAALCIGSGKADEIAALLDQGEGAGMVIFDNLLSPVQQRNLNQLLGVPVIDRTELILDIFAQRARSHEGKLQVELARIEHQMTRLVRGWSHLERQRGGVGLRGGPGEKQIELDRRMLDTKARRLRQQLLKLGRQRQTRRRGRERGGVFKVSLVGYTNSGKSTLFNALTRAGTYSADQLFATLDTLTRQMRLPDGRQIVLSDTVGFVRDLPHQLIEAFRATLEETADADLLVHVVDHAAPERSEQIGQVMHVLNEIGAGDVPLLTVYNKIDLLDRPAAVERDPCGTIDRVWLSARTGAGLDGLRDALAERRTQILEHTPAHVEVPSKHFVAE